MTERISRASPPGFARRVLRHPPTLVPLTVFGLITVSCLLVPLFWPHASSQTRLSLGATPPFATILTLTPAHPSAGNRLVDSERAARLAENGKEAMPGLDAVDWHTGDPFAWVEIPPIVRDRDRAAFRPVWIPAGAVDAYFQSVAAALPDGLDSLPGEPTDFTTVYTAARSSLRFPAGTDELGRDLFVRILEGGRISIAVGFAATLVSVTIGLFYGGLAGYVGGRTDALLMRIVDTLYALPFLLFVILLMVVFPRSLLLLFVAIGAVEWLTTARIVRGEVLALKNLPFVDAARCLGLGHAAILGRHILPNTLPPVIVYATLTVPTVILLESVLSFLGLGVQPPASSWGVLLNEGAERLQTYPWMLVFPAILFSLTLLCLNRVGDSLRDLLDPRTRS